MKTIKIVLGIILLIGLLGTLIGFFKQVNNYEASDLFGHLTAIGLISWGAYALLKPSKTK
ncbi:MULTISPECIES: hypothetical protein [unclassified Flavobacterium]|jgi:tetrahydromethanopterin S-methyltransferase subunit C|uniref:hypothetical protein n=1 Tax=unclassified Flavobacterium TaxID=196869 RepID=UPI0025BA70AF|nr:MULTISPECIES: hypothetical protein [unclassified Flavobacterium]